jgi:CrcB protein
MQHPAISAEWRLLVVTGFCGGFTTFSAFTSEVVWLMLEGRLAWALATVGANLVGAIVATYAGVKVFQASGL